MSQQYALLSEVYNDSSLKPKKRKKKKRSALSPMDLPQPLTPQEMDSELLDDDQDNYTGIHHRMPHMNTSPYTDMEIEYQTLPQKDYDMPNEYVQTRRPAPAPHKQPKPVVADDPEYLEFLEFKRNKSQPSTITSHNEQFNELLLYMFTGFFLLMLYDNIYKLGRDAY